MYFEHIFGNQRVQDILSHDIETRKLAHAYLLAGPPAIGKFSLLDCMAISIQAPETTSKAHTLAVQHAHPDISIIDHLPIEKEETHGSTNMYLEPRKSNTITVQDVKNIQNKLAHTTESDYAIAIIANIERMNKGAANSLLKIIEEPPSTKTLFLFSTSFLDQVPETIISRCKVLRLQMPSREETLKFLEQQNFTITHVEDLLKCIPPSPGYLYQLAHDQDAFEQVQSRVTNIIRLLEEPDVFSLFQYVGTIISAQEALLYIEHMEYYTQWIAGSILKNESKISRIDSILTVLKNTRKYLHSHVSVKLALEQCVLQIYPELQKLRS